MSVFFYMKEGSDATLDSNKFVDFSKNELAATCLATADGKSNTVGVSAIIKDDEKCEARLDCYGPFCRLQAVGVKKK